MRVLVTGAAGFIGAQVVRQLVAEGHEAFALVRPGGSTRRIDELGNRLNVVMADLADAPRMTAALRDVQPSAVIHLAWFAEPGRYLRAVTENVASLETSARLLLAAAEVGCPRVVLGGTCLERSDAVEVPIYAAAKGALHRLSEGFAGTELSVACGHVFYLFGPWEDERRVVPSVIRALINGQPIPTTDGLQQRDYLHVADVAAAFCVLAEASLGGGVDICSGSVVKLRDVLEMIGEETGRPELVRIGELGPSLDEGFPSSGDPEPLRRLGWQPRHDLRAGIIDTIAWWRSQEGPS